MQASAKPLKLRGKSNMPTTQYSRLSSLHLSDQGASLTHLALLAPKNPRPASVAVDNRLSVAFGQRTFDSEGLEKIGPYFSRSISWPKLGSSGVTIGRGYDMGFRAPQQVIRELTVAGMSEGDAGFLARGAGKRGVAAAQFVAAHRAQAPVMSLEVQKALFERITTPQMIGDIRRIFNKPDTVAAYGRANWDALSPTAQEIVFDLRYRGDYTPRTRQVIQPALAARDYDKLKAIMNDTAYWASLGVPAARIKERQNMALEL